jgi:hypothetical protein
MREDREGREDELTLHQDRLSGCARTMSPLPIADEFICQEIASLYRTDVLTSLGAYRTYTLHEFTLRPI